jgi:hypothetical protein
MLQSPWLMSPNEFTKLQFIRTGMMSFPEVWNEKAERVRQDSIDLSKMDARLVTLRAELLSKEKYITGLLEEITGCTEKLAYVNQDLVHTKELLMAEEYAKKALDHKLKLALKQIEDHADDFVIVVDGSIDDTTA